MLVRRPRSQVSTPDSPPGSPCHGLRPAAAGLLVFGLGVSAAGSDDVWAAGACSTLLNGNYAKVSQGESASSVGGRESYAYDEGLLMLRSFPSYHPSFKNGFYFSRFCIVVDIYQVGTSDHAYTYR